MHTHVHISTSSGSRCEPYRCRLKVKLAHTYRCSRNATAQHVVLNVRGMATPCMLARALTGQDFTDRLWKHISGTLPNYNHHYAVSAGWSQRMISRISLSSLLTDGFHVLLEAGTLLLAGSPLSSDFSTTASTSACNEARRLGCSVSLTVAAFLTSSCRVSAGRFCQMGLYSDQSAGRAESVFSDGYELAYFGSASIEGGDSSASTCSCVPDFASGFNCWSLQVCAQTQTLASLVSTVVEDLSFGTS